MRVWWINLDADDELDRGVAQTLGAEARARMQAMREGLRGGLVPVGDVVLTERMEAPSGAQGVAWCPTPAAVRALHRAGARVPATPPAAVLRRVNHRRWAAEQGTFLPRTAWVTDRAALVRHLTGAWPSEAWLLRPAFGFAGRGRVVVRALEALDDPRVGRRVTRALDGEGLLVEPLVRITEDYGLHGWIAPDGASVRGELTRQSCAPDGRWLASSRVPWSALADRESALLVDVWHATARALAAEGYWGPFGIDAFAWMDHRGERRFQPRCEVNARYSMGWSAGMGAARPDLVDAG